MLVVARGVDVHRWAPPDWWLATKFEDENHAKRRKLKIELPKSRARNEVMSVRARSKAERGDEALPTVGPEVGGGDRIWVAQYDLYETCNAHAQPRNALYKWVMIIMHGQHRREWSIDRQGKSKHVGRKRAKQGKN